MDGYEEILRKELREELEKFRNLLVAERKRAEYWRSIALHLLRYNDFQVEDGYCPDPKNLRSDIIIP